MSPNGNLTLRSHAYEPVTKVRSKIKSSSNCLEMYMASNYNIRNYT